MNRGNTSFSAFPVHRYFRSVKNDPKERLKEVCFDEACSAGAIEPIRGELRRDELQIVAASWNEP